MTPAWILIITTLAFNDASSIAYRNPSIETANVRIANEATCRAMERDFTYDRTLNGVRILGRARCYLDAPDVELPGRP